MWAWLGFVVASSIVYSYVTHLDDRGPANPFWPPALWLQTAGIILVIVMVVGALVWLKLNEDSDRLVASAAARGFAPAPAEELWRSGVANLAVVTEKASAELSNAFRCRVGDIDVWVFTLMWGEGDSSPSHAVVAFDLGAPALAQAFAMRPASSITRLLARMSVPLRSRGGFRERYQLTGAQSALPLLFQPELERFFEAEPHDWWIQTDRRWVAVFRVGTPLAAEHFDATVDDAARVFTALTRR